MTHNKLLHSVSLIFALFIVFPFAYLIYRFIEIPAIEAGKKLSVR